GLEERGAGEPRGAVRGQRRGGRRQGADPAATREGGRAHHGERFFAGCAREIPRLERQEMIDRGDEVTVSRQAQLLGLSRASVYYRARPVSQHDLKLMRRLDELHLEIPFYGARKLAEQLRRDGEPIGRKHVRTLMRRTGIEAIYRKPRTSIPARQAATYPYLLESLTVERANQVWT